MFNEFHPKMCIHSQPRRICVRRAIRKNEQFTFRIFRRRWPLRKQFQTTEFAFTILRNYKTLIDVFGTPYLFRIII